MKKRILYFTFLILAISSLSAQEFEKGTNVINAGIGLGSAYATSFSTSSQSLGLAASFERGVWEVPGPGVVSLGGFFGYRTYSYNFLGSEDRWTYTVIGARGAYHFNGLNIENLDLYGGAMISYRIVSFTGSSGSFGSSPGVDGFVGARWFFSDNFAAFAEAGYGFSYLTLGASFRI